MTATGFSSFCDQRLKAFEKIIDGLDQLTERAETLTPLKGDEGTLLTAEIFGLLPRIGEIVMAAAAGQNVSGRIYALFGEGCEDLHNLVNTADPDEKNGYLHACDEMDEILEALDVTIDWFGADRDELDMIAHVSGTGFAEIYLAALKVLKFHMEQITDDVRMEYLNHPEIKLRIAPGGNRNLSYN